MRHLSLVGVVKNRKVIRLARFCSWANHWRSAEDFAAHVMGAPTVHGMCEACQAEYARQIDAMPPKGAA